MTTIEYKNGDKVRLREPFGSYGVVLGKTEDGRYRIEWQFGVDHRGYPVIAKGSLYPDQIEPVSDTDFEERTSRLSDWSFD